jgi:hypothetical protein
MSKLIIHPIAFVLYNISKTFQVLFLVFLVLNQEANQNLNPTQFSQNKNL